MTKGLCIFKRRRNWHISYNASCSGCAELSLCLDNCSNQLLPIKPTTVWNWHWKA